MNIHSLPHVHMIYGTIYADGALCKLWQWYISRGNRYSQNTVIFNVFPFKLIQSITIHRIYINCTRQSIISWVKYLIPVELWLYISRVHNTQYTIELCPCQLNCFNDLKQKQLDTTDKTRQVKNDPRLNLAWSMKIL